MVGEQLHHTVVSHQSSSMDSRIAVPVRIVNVALVEQRHFNGFENTGFIRKLAAVDQNEPSAICVPGVSFFHSSRRH